MATIYKVTLSEVGSFINYNTYFGVADSIQDAIDQALAEESLLAKQAEQETGEKFEIELEATEVKAIAECGFWPKPQPEKTRDAA